MHDPVLLELAHERHEALKRMGLDPQADAQLGISQDQVAKMWGTYVAYGGYVYDDPNELAAALVSQTAKIGLGG